MSIYVIIVSGGTGSRMGSEIPKQFLELNGLPVLMHSMKMLYESVPSLKIILVLNKYHKDYWKSLCDTYNFQIPHSIVLGGDSRFHSVKNGLKHIEEAAENLDDALIAVHDGVRPLLTQEMIKEGFDVAKEKGTAVPVISSKDSIRLLDSEGSSKALNREQVVLVQTPQVFRSGLLTEAYKQEFSESFTDDASVVEKSGYPIHLYNGDIRNIKITYPIDLKIAEMLVAEAS